MYTGFQPRPRVHVRETVDNRERPRSVFVNNEVLTQRMTLSSTSYPSWL